MFSKKEQRQQGEKSDGTATIARPRQVGIVKLVRFIAAQRLRTVNNLGTATKSMSWKLTLPLKNSSFI